MSINFKKEFINECIKNREYLELTCKDMSLCLVNVSEDDYSNFESGKYSMSKENIERIMRVLCINKPKLFDINKYLDTKGLDEEEIEDLSKIVELIVGEDND